MAALLLALALQAPGGHSAADFSGIDQFWRIAHRLVADEDVSDEAWDSLFATPGYAALEERERRRAALELGIRAAVRPAEEARRDSLRAAGGWAARVAQHVEALVVRRRELDAFRAGLEQRNVLAAALSMTRTLLPAGSIERYGTPRVAFVFFLPDGRGYPGLIVADLAHSAARDDLDGYLAHEAVHFYYAALARERRAAGAEPTPQQQAVHVLLTKLFEESVGDQFDKRPYLENDGAALRGADLPAERRAYLEEYRHGVRHAAEGIAELDAALAAAGDDAGRLRAAADSLNAALPLEGRPLGYAITSTIRRVLGDAALVAALGDPIAWLAAYQRAAREPSCGCRPLSEPLDQALGLTGAARASSTNSTTMRCGMMPAS